MLKSRYWVWELPLSAHSVNIMFQQKAEACLTFVIWELNVRFFLFLSFQQQSFVASNSAIMPRQFRSQTSPIPRLLPFPGQFCSQAGPTPMLVPFPGQFHSQVSPIPMLVPFPGQSHFHVSSIPRLVPFPGQSHSHVSPIPRLVPFPGQSHSHVSSIPRLVPFPGQFHSQVSSIPRSLPSNTENDRNLVTRLHYEHRPLVCVTSLVPKPHMSVRLGV